ncbi:MAG: VWA domain-containing protein [Actinobacteria bacterium]|nr:VWA domain-containing protein [Actinomycetota bacterium]
MKNRLLKALGLIILLSILMLSAVDVAQAASTSQENVAVVLVIDNSGSMKSTDSAQERLTAAKLIVDLLGQEDRMGVIYFESEAHNAQEFTLLADSGRESLKGSIDGIPEADGYTDYMKALQEAERMLDGLTDPSYQKAIVFLTDGTPDPDEVTSGNAALMDSYMAGFWEEVASLGTKGYPVYTVGFGGSSGEILQRIGEETGALSFSNQNPSEIASSFFEIIGSLKGREILFDTTMQDELTGTFDFVIDTNTKQVNCLVLGDVSLSELQLTGNSSQQSFVTDTGDGYSMMVVDNQSEGNIGAWTLRYPVREGVSVLVCRDTKIRLQIQSPTINAQFSTEAPIPLEVVILGTEEVLSVEARCLVNGYPQGGWLTLTQQEGIYRATYDEQQGTGEYAFEFRVLQGGTTLTRRTIPVNVRELPVLNVDIGRQSDRLVGESMVCRAWLSRSGKPLLPSNELEIGTAELVFRSDTGEIVTALLDTGVDGDLVPADGAFASIATVESPGSVEGEVRVRGVYRGEEFVLTQAIEPFSVVEPGAVETIVNGGQSIVYGVVGEEVAVPLTVTNQSAYAETIEVVSGTSDVTLRNQLVSVEALGSTEQVFYLTIPADDQAAELSVDLTIRAGHESTSLSTQQVSLSVVRQTPIKSFMGKVQAAFLKYGIPALAIAGVILLVFLVRKGLISNKRKQEELFKGVLFYRKSGARDWSSLDIGRLNSGRLIGTELGSTQFTIGFGANVAGCDLDLDKEGPGFVLTLKNNPTYSGGGEATIKARCTLPGIIEVRGTKASMADFRFGERFTCGNHEFEIRSESAERTTQAEI